MRMYLLLIKLSIITLVTGWSCTVFATSGDHSTSHSQVRQGGPQLFDLPPELMEKVWGLTRAKERATLRQVSKYFATQQAHNSFSLNVPEIYHRLYPKMAIPSDPYRLYRFCLWEHGIKDEPTLLEKTFPTIQECLDDVDHYFTKGPESISLPALHHAQIQVLYDYGYRRIDLQVPAYSPEYADLYLRHAHEWSVEHKRAVLFAMVAPFRSYMVNNYSDWAIRTMNRLCPSMHTTLADRKDCIIAMAHIRSIGAEEDPIARPENLSKLTFNWTGDVEATLDTFRALHKPLCVPNVPKNVVFEALSQGISIGGRYGSCVDGMNGLVSRTDIGSSLLSFKSLKSLEPQQWLQVIQKLAYFGYDMNVQNNMCTILAKAEDEEGRATEKEWISSHNLVYMKLVTQFGATLPPRYPQNTCMNFAADLGLADDVRFLLQHGENSNVQTFPQSVWTPLMWASNADVARILLEYDADPSLKVTSLRRTALHIAAERGRADVVDVLTRPDVIKDGLIDVSDDIGNSALILASTPQVVRLLLERGADPNFENKNGVTPLIAHENVESVKALLEYGAICDHRDKDGRTALEYANNASLVSVIIKHGGLDYVSDLFKAELLIAAMSENVMDVIEAILLAGLDVNQPIRKGDISPLEWAKRHHLEAVPFLLHHSKVSA